MRLNLQRLEARDVPALLQPLAPPEPATASAPTTAADTQPSDAVGPAAVGVLAPLPPPGTGGAGTTVIGAGTSGYGYAGTGTGTGGGYSYTGGVSESDGAHGGAYDGDAYVSGYPDGAPADPDAEGDWYLVEAVWAVAWIDESPPEPADAPEPPGYYISAPAPAINAAPPDAAPPAGQPPAAWPQPPVVAPAVLLPAPPAGQPAPPALPADRMGLYIPQGDWNFWIGAAGADNVAARNVEVGGATRCQLTFAQSAHAGIVAALRGRGVADADLADILNRLYGDLASPGARPDQASLLEWLPPPAAKPYRITDLAATDTREPASERLSRRIKMSVVFGDLEGGQPQTRNASDSLYFVERFDRADPLGNDPLAPSLSRVLDFLRPKNRVDGLTAPPNYFSVFAPPGRRRVVLMSEDDFDRDSPLKGSDRPYLDWNNVPQGPRIILYRDPVTPPLQSDFGNRDLSVGEGFRILQNQSENKPAFEGIGRRGGATNVFFVTEGNPTTTGARAPDPINLEVTIKNGTPTKTLTTAETEAMYHQVQEREGARIWQELLEADKAKQLKSQRLNWELQNELNRARGIDVSGRQPSSGNYESPKEGSALYLKLRESQAIILKGLTWNEISRMYSKSGEVIVVDLKDSLLSETYKNKVRSFQNGVVAYQCVDGLKMPMFAGTKRVINTLIGHYPKWQDRYRAGRPQRRN